MKKLLVGDTGEYLSVEAKKINSKAILLDNTNYNLIKTQNGIYYTSLGDVLQVALFCQILMHADEIIFCPPPGKWSDKNQISTRADQRFTIETETKEHLFQWMWVTQKSVKNLSLPKLNKDIWKIRSRASSSSQIWNVGCSITHGYGIELDQRYGELIAKTLNKPLTILSHPGASIQWAANEILMSDLLPGDQVIWGLTALNRYPYALHDQRLYHINHNFYQHYPLSEKLVSLEWLTSPNHLYHSINSILNVQNFCKKINVDLFLLGFLDIQPYIDHVRLLNLSPISWIDYASDNSHPGPKTHQIFANKTIEYINQNKTKL